MEKIPHSVFIHRGRNVKADFLGGQIAEADVVFDYRGRHTLVMLWRAFRAAFHLPRARVYIAEGGLCYWPALLRKLLVPGTRIVLMAPEPVFNWRQRSGIKNSILRLLFGFADFILPISRLVKEDMRRYIDRPHAILHHYATLDYSKLARITPDYEAKNILFMIRRPKETGWTKGLDIVLEIFRLLRERDPSFHLYLIGYGTEDLPRGQNIHLEGDRDPTDYFALCPYLLAPARYDSFPLATVEGCAAGELPLISNTTGTEEFIRDVHSGLVLDYRAPAVFVDALLELSSMPRNAKEVLAAKLRAAARRYTREASVAELEAALPKIISAIS